MHARLIGVLFVVGVTGPVYAQPASGGPPMLAPGFALLDRQDGQSRIGGDLTYYLVDNDNNSPRVMRLDLHGQFIDPQSRIGGYAALPIAFADDSNSDGITAVGNAEIGGIYIPRLHSPDVALVLHGGLTLPTGETNLDALTGFFVGLMRPTDIVQAYPRSSSLRFGVSPIYRNGSLFLRGDFGVDVNIYVDQGDTADPAIHLNLGVGYDAGSVAITGELSILDLTGDNSESVTVGGVSVRGTGHVRPYGALVVPLDDDVSNIFDLGLMVGVEANL